MVDVIVDEASADTVADGLWSRGVGAIEERPGPHAGTVILRTSLGGDPASLVAAIVESYPDVSCEIRLVPRSVTDTWRRHAVAVRVDDDTVFVPAWLDAPPAACIVRIEPADQFGLGNHASTVLAARLGLRYVGRDDMVLDIGCGTGVLALACHIASQCRVMVTDLAPGARTVVEHNMVLNDVAENALRWVDGMDRVEDASVSMCLANILAPVLRTIAPEVLRVTRPGGIAVLSGMRDEQVTSVLDEYPGCEEIDRASSEGWTAVAIRRGSWVPG